MSQIDELRTNNLQLTDPDSISNTAADMLKSEQPISVWLSYNVHGNDAECRNATA